VSRVLNDKQEDSQLSSSSTCTSSESHTETLKINDGSFSDGQTMESEPVSLLQFLNILVYLLLFSGMLYYLNRDFDSIATKWFVRMFPREAETLGLHHIE
jgi:hypothetical protein